MYGDASPTPIAVNKKKQSLFPTPPAPPTTPKQAEDKAVASRVELS